MKELILTIVQIILPMYTFICALFYFFQEELIFRPEKLPKDFGFRFRQDFQEITFTTHDQKKLHSLLFKSEQTKGLVFYLHGNAGSLNSWGEAARVYTNLNYDVFMVDYRGYGKSEGEINGEKILHQDIQAAYDLIKTSYDEKEIIVLGYSIGTGLATKLASTNHPRLLILQAPFLSLTEVVQHHVPIIPSFLVKYKLENLKHIQTCKMPIVIFHGKADEVVDYSSSAKLKGFARSLCTLIPLDDQGHNGMSSHPVYLQRIKRILK